MGCSGEVAEPPLRYVVFGGNCAATPARFVLEGTSGTPADLRLTPNAVQASVPRRLRQRLMLDPGDGVVTKPSLLGRDALEPYTPRHQFSYFPLAYTFLLCEEHDALTNNVSFRDNLLDVLLTQSKPWELHKDHAVDGS